MTSYTRHGRIGMLFNPTVNLLTSDHIFNILEVVSSDRESLVIERGKPGKTSSSVGHYWLCFQNV